MGIKNKALAIKSLLSATHLNIKKTDAETTINLYEQTGKTVQKWQSQLLYDILAKNNE